MIRFKEVSRRKTWKTICPLRRDPDDDTQWRHPYNPQEHPDWSLTETKTGAFVPAPPPPAKPVSAVGKKVADVLAKLRRDCAGSPMRQASEPRKPRKRREGDLTITEYGATKGLGPRQVRDALKTLGILQEEIEVRDRGTETPPRYLHTLRLTPDAVDEGLGRRLEPYSGAAYDVLTLKGRRRLDQMVVRKGNRRHLVRDRVRDLVARGKTQAEIVRETGLSKQLVSHHMRKAA